MFNNSNHELRQSTNSIQTGNSSTEQEQAATGLDSDPRLSQVNPLKLKIIQEIAEKSKGKSVEEMLPQIMKVNQELSSRNISFTKEETALLMDVIEESLPAKDKVKFNMLKGFMK